MPALPVPPGYVGLRPFDRRQHGVLGIDEAARCRLAARLNAIVVTAPEFFQAARCFPIAFTRSRPEDPLLAVAVTSFVEGQNRFVDATGMWDRGAYVPVYVRSYPFHTVTVARPCAETDYLVCVDEAGLSASASPLFDPSGEPSDAWRELEQLIRDVEVARRQSQLLFDQIDSLSILEPFVAHGVGPDGRTLHLSNLLRINEDKLNRLPAKKLKTLMSAGILGRLYAHLMSLDNFALLLDREIAATDP